MKSVDFTSTFSASSSLPHSHRLFCQVVISSFHYAHVKEIYFKRHFEVEIRGIKSSCDDVAHKGTNPLWQPLQTMYHDTKEHHRGF